MDEYVQETVLREQLADLRRRAARYHLLHEGGSPRARNRGWPVIRQRLADVASAFRLWRRAQRLAVR